MVANLGCPAEHYTVKIHHVGGAEPAFARIRTGVAEVTWSRDLDAVSEARVVIARQVIDAGCDRQLRRVRPWAHELTLYRAGDSQPVWCGPITVTERTRTTYTITARDLGAWLEVRTNPESYNWSDLELTEMARRLVRMGLTGRGNPDPNFWPHARFDPTPELTTDREQRRTYAVAIRDELDALCDQGMDYTVTRRRLWCHQEANRATAAQGRLTHNDIVDELSLVVDGEQTATRWIVEGESADGDRVRAIEGGEAPYYGLVERSTRAQLAQTQGACRMVAQARLRYSRNPPAMVIVPDGATLHPRAPITIDQLIPGTRWDISLVDYIDDTTTPSKLTQVSVTAEPSKREQIAVSFVPIGSEE